MRVSGGWLCPLYACLSYLPLAGHAGECVCVCVGGGGGVFVFLFELSPDGRDMAEWGLAVSCVRVFRLGWAVSCVRVFRLGWAVSSVRFFVQRLAVSSVYTLLCAGIGCVFCTPVSAIARDRLAYS